MTPIDVVKTRIQLEPALGKLGMVGTARSIVANEGPKGLLTGFGPTAVGYLVQVSAPCPWRCDRAAGTSHGVVPHHPPPSRSANLS